MDDLEVPPFQETSLWIGHGLTPWNSPRVFSKMDVEHPDDFPRVPGEMMKMGDFRNKKQGNPRLGH